MAGQQFFDVIAMGTKGTKGPTNVTRFAADANGVPYYSMKGGPFLGLAGGLADEEQLIARSVGVFGAQSFAHNFDDLFGPLASFWQVLGVTALVNNRGPGVVSMTSANDTIIIKQTGAFVVNPSVTPWHVGGRILLANSIQANDVKGFQGVAVVSGNPDTDSVFVGVRQSASSTFFSFGLIKATVVKTALSTVPVNIGSPAWHKCEIWFDGARVFGSVDNETPVLVGTSADCPTVALQERHGADAASGGGTDTFLDYTYAAAVRTAT